MTVTLQVTDLHKELQGVPILRGVTFHLAAGERVGVVGANGCGKSTLMRILAGEWARDGGAVHWVHPGVAKGYLSQEDHWDEARPLGEQLGSVAADLLSRCGIAPALLARPAGALSGGQKVRAALARALAGRPQVLLLDEPTNHLDADGLQWLESILLAYRGAVLVVSHDRYFLDRVAGRILDLDGGVMRSYTGNYTAYAAAKQAEWARQVEEYRQYLIRKRELEAAIRKRMDWATRGHNEKPPPDAHKFQKGYNQRLAQAHVRQAKAMETRLERIKVTKPQEAQQVKIQMDAGRNVGRNLVLAESLGFTYDGRHWVLRGAHFFVQRGERVSVIGPNGAGKTTLLKLLLGELVPTEGRIYVAPVQVAYLAQELETLDPRLTVLEEATGNSAADQAGARSLLGCLLFTGELVHKRVGVLSRGEKIRLALAKILLQAPDLLVLDEPTNGLDLLSRERVEEALEGYTGTMLLCSHDRYLLRRLSTQVLALGGGKVESYPGSFADWMERQARPQAARDPGERLVLETRLAQVSAALAGAPPDEAARLQAEFLRLTQALRSL